MPTQTSVALNGGGFLDLSKSKPRRVRLAEWRQRAENLRVAVAEKLSTHRGLDALGYREISRPRLV